MEGPLQITPEFSAILDELENGDDHLFITGKAGTGKSTLLSTFRNMSQKNIVVLAPTGVAALNVKGQTIHSFFRIPPKLIRSEDLKTKRGMAKLLKSVDIIIIDEISMVRADLFDHMDYLLRFYRKSEIPFGGVRLLMFGDLYQLPPVVADKFEQQYFFSIYESPHFFSAKVFEKGFQMYLIELKHVFRQKDEAFINLLDRIRLKTFDENDLKALNDRHSDVVQWDDAITLTSTNYTADQINTSKLRGISAPSKVYTAEQKGKIQPQNMQAEVNLELKVGAQVMLIRNDTDGRYVNGSLAKVTELNEKDIKVRLIQESEDIKIKKSEWEVIKYKAEQDGSIKEEVVGSLKQFPIRLAWAVTIHKSQGKTFDKVIIDLGRGAFEHGQAYVALSRCKTLKGIALKRTIKPSDIIIDEKIMDFYNAIK